jgi:cytochrome P450
VLSSPRKYKCTDIIEAFVYEKLENKEEFSYSDTELIDEFQTFLVAGTDTTTRFFSMIIYYLGNHPEILKKLREEITAVIKSDEDITFENLKKLTYIDWIQYETTRMYGPANGIFLRIAKEDNYLKDLPITKGTVVSTQPRGNHFNPKYFKDPNVFRPERW